MKISTPSIDGLTIADKFAKYTGILGWMRCRCARGITLLMYHKVLPSQLISAYPLRNLVVEISSFNHQMEWLRKHFEVVTVRDAMARIDLGARRKTHARRPLACVTFDDGYRDNFEYAAPILESHGLRATFFVTTGFVEGTTLWFDRAAQAWHRDAAATLMRASEAIPSLRESIAEVRSFDAWWQFLKQLSQDARQTVLHATDVPALATDEVFCAMTIEHVRELAKRGHEIGSHSVTHPILTNLDKTSLTLEMGRSRSLVREWTGQHVEGFCYPNGDHDERVVSAARAAGYKYACMLRRGIACDSTDRMALPRRGILSSDRREMTIEGFESEVVGWNDLLRRSREQLVLYLGK